MICRKRHNNTGLSVGESLSAPFGRKPLLVRLLQYCLSLLVVWQIVIRQIVIWQIVIRHF